MVIAEGRAGERHLASGCPMPSPICLTVTWLLPRAAPGSYAVDLSTCCHCDLWYRHTTDWRTLGRRRRFWFWRNRQSGDVAL